MTELGIYHSQATSPDINGLLELIRYCGYKSNSDHDGHPQTPTKTNENKKIPSRFYGLIWVPYEGVHGQNTDNPLERFSPLFFAGMIH